MEIPIRKKLVSPPLAEGTISFASIPFLIYKFFLFFKEGEETTCTIDGQITKWCKLRIDIPEKDKKVVMIFTSQHDGDAVETKFALETWAPQGNPCRESYSFEINALPKSDGWSLGEGNAFTETLTFVTNKALELDHPIIAYASAAMMNAGYIQKDKKAVPKKFIDHAPKPPR